VEFTAGLVLHMGSRMGAAAEPADKAAAATPIAPPKSAAVGGTKNGMRSRIAADTERFTRGAAICVKLEIENLSEHAKNLSNTRRAGTTRPLSSSMTAARAVPYLGGLSQIMVPRKRLKRASPKK